MKFIHMADMHFDAPFVTLAGKGNLATERRLEQRNVMKQIVEYIKQNNIPYLYLSDAAPNGSGFVNYLYENFDEILNEILEGNNKFIKSILL